MQLFPSVFSNCHLYFQRQVSFLIPCLLSSSSCFSIVLTLVQLYVLTSFMLSLPIFVICYYNYSDRHSLSGHFIIYIYSGRHILSGHLESWDHIFFPRVIQPSLWFFVFFINFAASSFVIWLAGNNSWSSSLIFSVIILCPLAFPSLIMNIQLFVVQWTEQFFFLRPVILPSTAFIPNALLVFVHCLL